MKKFIPILSLLMLLVVVGTSSCSPDINIAKGCPVTFSPTPNYGNTGNNPASITDGIYTSNRLWLQNGAVGWESIPVASTTIDLLKIQPISGLSFSTASGDDSVQWPVSIVIWVSDDSKEWRYAGDLVSLSEKNGMPPMEHYANHRYVTHDLKTRGRYVRLSVVAGYAFVFCDEIEVYKGAAGLLNKTPKGNVVKDIDSYMSGYYFPSRIIYRRRHDADAVSRAVKAAKVTAAVKERLTRRLDAIYDDIDTVTQKNTDSFEAVLPIDATDAAIFSVYGSLLEAQGFPKVFAWKKNSYDFLTPTDAPAKLPKQTGLSISMMGNEYRSDSVLLTNASDKPRDVKIRINGFSKSPKPEWMSIYAMPWTDTASGTPIAAALVPAKYSDGVFTVHIPAGMVSKIWVTVDSHILSAGNYKGAMTASSANIKLTIPMNVYVSSIKMSRPRLSFCAWDYAFEPGRYHVTEKTYDAALATMRTHFLDTPWAHSGDLPWPTADSFDSNGKLVKPLVFNKFDQWIKNWPDARHYFVYLNGPTDMCGSPMGSDEFNARVGSWMNALADHMRSIGRNPSQLGLMIRDEPGEESRRVIIGWAKAIRASHSGISICQDCNISRPDESPLMPETLQLADISIPMLGTYHVGGRVVESFFKDLVKSGHTMWFYQCEGPGHELDPYRYNRLEAWHCFKHGAKGMGVWAFGDIGKYNSSWNPYPFMGDEYSPLFFRPTDITSGIHWEALREGIEDNEYLSMLKDRARNTNNAELKSQAEKLLTESVNAVVGTFTSATPRWNLSNGSSQADIYRIKILRMLDKMNSVH